MISEFILQHLVIYSEPISKQGRVRCRSVINKIFHFFVRLSELLTLDSFSVSMRLFFSHHEFICNYSIIVVSWCRNRRSPYNKTVQLINIYNDNLYSL